MAIFHNGDYTLDTETAIPMAMTLGRTAYVELHQDWAITVYKPSVTGGHTIMTYNAPERIEIARPDACYGNADKMPTEVLDVLIAAGLLLSV